MSDVDDLAALAERANRYFIFCVCLADAVDKHFEHGETRLANALIRSVISGAAPAPTGFGPHHLLAIALPWALRGLSVGNAKALSSPAFLNSLDDPKLLSHIVMGRHKNALECLLDCPDASLASKTLHSMPRPIPRASFANILRRSADPAEARQRMDTLDQAGLLDAKLLLLLERNSSWCGDNNIAALALAERERRALGMLPRLSPRGPQLSMRI